MENVPHPRRGGCPHPPGRFDNVSGKMICINLPFPSVRSRGDVGIAPYADGEVFVMQQNL